MGEFRSQLTYKSEWNRKHLVVINRFFPSSRLCRGCGAVNDELTLSDRHWVCRCGLVHDRDGSAAAWGVSNPLLPIPGSVCVYDGSQAWGFWP